MVDWQSLAEIAPILGAGLTGNPQTLQATVQGYGEGQKIKKDQNLRSFGREIFSLGHPPTEQEIQQTAAKYGIDPITVQAVVSKFLEDRQAKKIMELKEKLENPKIIDLIHEIFIPRDFMRIDQILEIAFAAVNDIVGYQAGEDEGRDGKPDTKSAPASFHAECIERIQKKLNATLIKQTRASFASANGKVALVCSASRYHEKAKIYWFSFHPYQNEFLNKAPESYVAYECGTPDKLYLIPHKDFKSWLKNFSKTDREDRLYWHIKIKETVKSARMVGKKGAEGIDLNPYLLRS